MQAPSASVESAESQPVALPDGTDGHPYIPSTPRPAPVAAAAVAAFNIGKC